MDTSKLVAASVVTKHQSVLDFSLDIISPKNLDGHWLHFHDAIEMAGHNSYDFAKLPPYKNMVSAGSLQPK